MVWYFEEGGIPNTCMFEMWRNIVIDPYIHIYLIFAWSYFVQMSSKDGQPIYSGIMDCVTKTLKNEGMMSFYVVRFLLNFV